MQEKRRVHRLNIDLPVTFKQSGGQQHISIGATLNVSAIGLCLRTKEELEIGDKLFVTVQLPGGRNLVIDGEVMWVRELDFFKHKDYAVGFKIRDNMKMNEADFVKFFAKEFLSSYKDKLTP